MNINRMIMTLEDVTGIPVAQDVYDGNSDKWITFTYADERCTLYADNDEEAVEVSINVSLFTTLSFNYFQVKKQIKETLKALGFQIEYIQSYVEQSDIGTERVRHTVFVVNYTGSDI